MPNTRTRRIPSDQKRAARRWSAPVLVLSATVLSACSRNDSAAPTAAPTERQIPPARATATTTVGSMADFVIARAISGLSKE
jgi:hypothetical protein